MGGGARLGRMSMTPTPPPTPPAADRPAHYRLSTGTWELIVKEYREGATAPFLSRKWRVSEHAIRKRVTQHGATKRDWGDAQAIGQALAREAELEEARRNSPEAVAARLFSGIETGEDEDDPAMLARTATRVSGRAMKGRLWAEAKALAGLAETYARLESRAVADRRNGMTIDTVDIRLLAEILMHPNPDERLAMWNFKEGTPEHEIGRAYWKQASAKTRFEFEQRDARVWYVQRLVGIIHDLGGKAPEPPWITGIGMRVGDGIDEAAAERPKLDRSDPFLGPEDVDADGAVRG
jgi:hypothetical protein